MQDNKEHLRKLKGLVNNQTQWAKFNNYLDCLIEQQHRMMEQTEDVSIIYRGQGAIFTLRRLKLLRDEVLKND